MRIEIIEEPNESADGEWFFNTDIAIKIKKLMILVSCSEAISIQLLEKCCVCEDKCYYLWSLTLLILYWIFFILKDRSSYRHYFQGWILLILFLCIPIGKVYRLRNDHFQLIFGPFRYAFLSLELIEKVRKVEYRKENDR